VADLPSGLSLTPPPKKYRFILTLGKDHIIIIINIIVRNTFYVLFHNTR
jgi:hypothetical protein